MNKNQNKGIRILNKSQDNIPKISENKQFLLELYNNSKNEIKKVNAYLNQLHHNQKIIKQLINEVE